jgi:TM2 domain-containing membrane protein YozV
MALENCRECGKQISSQAVACPHCGAPIKDSGVVNNTVPISVTKSKNRSLAILLAVLLGGLGIHKFYLDRPGWGIIYMLLCWTFIPVILGFIEGIFYLSLSDESFQERYRQGKA